MHIHPNGGDKRETVEKGEGVSNHNEYAGADNAQPNNLVPDILYIEVDGVMGGA
jgi:hypothetical protein